jgi:hypothetical protein
MLKCDSSPLVSHIPYQLKYRHWRPLGLQEVEAATFSDISLIDGCKVCELYVPAAFYPQEDY